MQNIHQYQQLAATYITDLGTKLLAVILFWVVGRWLIGLVGKMLQQMLEKRKVDPTLRRYLGNIVAVTRNIVLVVLHPFKVGDFISVVGFPAPMPAQLVMVQNQ